jgi:hypothetical protein
MPRIYVIECRGCGSTVDDPKRDDFDRELCGKCIDREIDGEVVVDDEFC